MENEVVVPGGFHLAEDSGETVQEGIVIEDEIGNQFVWIPVSNLDHKGSNPIKIQKEGKTQEVEITLGRYTFSTKDGTETPIQYANTYTTPTKLTSSSRDYYEYADWAGESNQGSGTEATNVRARNLKGFVLSVKENHGYYIARYEASYGSGSQFGVGDNASYYKPLSQPSTNAVTSDWKAEKGYLWNFIMQGNASMASRQMYYGNSYVESDLVNSYMWDTAIVYIQAMGNENYANANIDTTGNTTLLNTGSTGDVKCNIYDMAGNTYEWTTEYCTVTPGSHVYPCVVRGGSYNISSVNYTAVRNRSTATSSNDYFSFRPALYIKE